MIKSARWVLLSVVLLGLMAMPASSTAQVFTPYDTFAKFDPAKWRGTEFQPGNNQEMSRMLVKGRLQLFLLSVGSEANDTGSSGFGNTGVRHPNPAAIVGMQAVVTMVQATTQQCPDNDDPNNQPTVRAEIRGSFFNDGGSTGPADLTGDVIARIEKRFAPFGLPSTPMRIRLQLARCADAACNTSTALPGSPIQFAAPTTLGQAHVLRLFWDKVNNQVIGSILDAKGKIALETQQIGYPPPLNDLAPVAPFKELRVQAGNPNCTDGGTISAVQALFGNVAVASAP